MKCLACGFEDSKVIDSRNVDDNTIRRRRECLACSWRWTTYETSTVPNLYVLKQSGKREVFDRQKILNGIMRACQKRDVSIEKIESITKEIEMMVDV